VAPPPGSWCSGRWRPSPQQTQAQLEVNLFGAPGGYGAFLPQMRQRGSGRIVNVSSVMGRFALPGSGHVRRTQSLEGNRTCTG
jgi:NAD(P)-dependent dehydrogenase (short-subunit alcohol dehydrogenase family)